MRLTFLFAVLALVLLGSSVQAQYGVEFSAPETTMTIYPDTTTSTENRFPLHIKNVGSVSDQFIINYPGQSLPPDWFATFCDDHICYGLPCTVAVNPGDTIPNHIHVAITVFGETGTGWVLCSVTSVGNPNLHPELRFWVHAFPNGVEANGEGLRGLSGHGVRITPNPMREGCTALWEGAKGQDAVFGIYDLQGRRLVTLRSTTGLFLWDGSDALGRALPAGTYFYVAESGGRRVSGKILRIR